MNIISYITEEVERQGHDTRALDGLERVGWMLEAWCWALYNCAHAPTVSAAIHLGHLIEPTKNKRGNVRGIPVWVGRNRTPDPRELEGLLFNLFDKKESMLPMDFYKEFEYIHPFVDGNGRTGKILLNWLNGSLLDPIFPPNDLFGRHIRNP
jgi:hypothetical protein